MGDRFNFDFADPSLSAKLPKRIVQQQKQNLKVMFLRHFRQRGMPSDDVQQLIFVVDVTLNQETIGIDLVLLANRDRHWGVFARLS